MNQTTLKNRTIFCRDNLDILRGINTASIDLIYLDPPFNKNKAFTAPIGSKAEGASFSDIFREEDVKDEWLHELREDNPHLANYLDSTAGLGNKYNKYYLVYMARRLIEMYRILKPTGSLYLHCDPTMSHYIKLLMDGLFGEGNFRNEIVWCYTGAYTNKARQFPRKHDLIFWYSKGSTWTFNVDSIRVPYKSGGPHMGGHGPLGQLTKEAVKVYEARGKTPESWWQIRTAYVARSEYTGYPTQKPIPLLERIIKASTNKGDLVLDPFCGCATTCVAAERLERKWVGIDVSPKAYTLVQMRLKKEVERKGEIFNQKVIYRTDLAVNKLTRREIKSLLYGNQKGYCLGCRVHFRYPNLELDHITPSAKGGGDNVENLQLLCANCNRVKGDRDMGYLHAQLKQQAS